MHNQQRVEFKPPAGVVPEGTQAGEDFDLVCTFRIKPNGSVCLTMMGDAKMPGYGEKPDKESRPGYGSEVKEMQQTSNA